MDRDTQRCLWVFEPRLGATASGPCAFRGGFHGRCGETLWLKPPGTHRVEYLDLAMAVEKRLTEGPHGIENVDEDTVRRTRAEHAEPLELLLHRWNLETGSFEAALQWRAYVQRQLRIEIGIASRTAHTPRADGKPANHSVTEVQTVQRGNGRQKRARQSDGHGRIAASNGAT